MILFCSTLLCYGNTMAIDITISIININIKSCEYDLEMPGSQNTDQGTAMMKYKTQTPT